MHTFFLTLSFIFTHLLLFFPIKKMVFQDKIDNDFLFIYISNHILLLAFVYYFVISSQLFFSFFVSLFSMVFSYLLIYHIKNILGKYQLLSLPYFFLSVYTFANILMLCLF